MSIKATADLKHGVRHHRQRVSERLGRRNVYQKLVHVETFDGLSAAVAREREIASWSRARQSRLITRCNPTWKSISIREYLSRQRKASQL